jgi:hypothetical protein
MYKYRDWMSAACDCLQHALKPIVLKVAGNRSLKETFINLLEKFHRDAELSVFGGVADFHLAMINPIVNQWIGMYYGQMDDPQVQGIQFPLQRLFELEVLLHIEQGPAIGVHDILKDAIKAARQGELTPEPAPKPKHKRQLKNKVQQELGTKGSPTKKPKVVQKPIDFRAPPTAGAEKTATESQLKRAYALMTHWVNFRKQSNIFVTREDCLNKVAHTKILYFRDIESQVAELEFLQWYSNVTAVYTHFTVPLGGRKSRRLELLAFDEQSTFDTSA